jgi:hypothetical protein
MDGFDPFSNILTAIASGLGAWEAAFQKASAFVEQLNETEKSAFVTGKLDLGCSGIIVPIERVNFPGLCLQDGSNAIRIADKATVFPAGLATAASFDRSLIYARSYALGEEFKAKGAHVLLGFDDSLSICSYRSLMMALVLRSVRLAGILSEVETGKASVPTPIWLVKQQQLRLQAFKMLAFKLAQSITSEMNRRRKEALLSSMALSLKPYPRILMIGHCMNCIYGHLLMP